MKNVFTILLLLIPTIFVGQGWEKILGIGFGRSVQQTVDEGYIVTGYTDVTNNKQSDVILFKTDIIGDVLWSKTYGGDSYDEGYSVIQTADGGFIIVGITQSFGNHGSHGAVYLLKIDKNGNEIWFNTFGDGDMAKGVSIQQTSDGDYIIVGSTDPYGQIDTDILLIKVSESGNLIWSKTYGGEYSDHGASVRQTIDGGYIIIGSTILVEYGDNVVYLVKTDSNGNEIWSKHLSGSDRGFGNSVQQTSDHGYIITGTIGKFQTDVFLIKTDSEGNILWTKTFGELNGSDHGNSIQQTKDGGYIIVGHTASFGNGYYDVLLIKTDNSGNPMWTKTFGEVHVEYGLSVQQTIDGGYIITGYTDSAQNGNWNVLLIKTDENGALLTSEVPVAKPNRKLVKIVDLTGREIAKPKINQPYIEVYNDGSREKKMVVNKD